MLTAAVRLPGSGRHSHAARSMSEAQPAQSSRSQAQLLQALHQARAAVAQSASTAEDRRIAGPVLSEIDRALAALDPATALDAALTPGEAAVLPGPDETEALRREIERLRVLAGEAQMLGEHEHVLLHTLLEQSPHGVLVCDLQGRLILHNRAAERIWAGSATTEGIADWGKYRAYHPDGRPYEPEDWAMARCLSRREVVQAEEVHFQRFDGTHGILLGSCAPLVAPDGRLLGAISVFADITHFKEMEAENARLYRRAEEALRLRDELLASVTHDLRSPLAAVKAQAQRLAQRAAAMVTREGERLAAGLAHIDAAATRMGALIDELLDLAQLQMGRDLALDRAPADLVTLASRLAAELRQVHPGHIFTVHAPVQDVHGYVDAARLERVLANLLSNAAKYSPAGSEVRLEVSQEEQDGRRWAILVVEDQGMGIPAADLPYIFERFHRGSNVAGRVPGTGLGLAGAHRIIEQHGGTISVESEEGQGSRFTIRLPLSA